MYTIIIDKEESWQGLLDALEFSNLYHHDTVKAGVAGRLHDWLSGSPDEVHVMHTCVSSPDDGTAVE